jgi:anti-sigma factor RsiW
MIEAAETVGAFVADRNRADLDADRVLLFALVRAIEIIGEAASRLSPENRAAAPAVPWVRITGQPSSLRSREFPALPPLSFSVSRKRSRRASRTMRCYSPSPAMPVSVRAPSRYHIR